MKLQPWVAACVGGREQPSPFPHTLGLRLQSQEQRDRSQIRSFIAAAGSARRKFPRDRGGGSGCECNTSVPKTRPGPPVRAAYESNKGVPTLSVCVMYVCPAHRFTCESVCEMQGSLTNSLPKRNTDSKANTKAESVLRAPGLLLCL